MTLAYSRYITSNNHASPEQLMTISTKIISEAKIKSMSRETITLSHKKILIDIGL
jgi:hypothetical protein